MSATALLRMPRKALQWLRIAKRAVRARRDGLKVVNDHELAEHLATQRGLAMKGGQILAGATGDNALKALVTSIGAIPLEQIRPLLETQLGRPLEKLFLYIEESQAAASLGQVHKGTLLDGRTVAVKVRYPNIVEDVKADLGLMNLLPAAGPARQWQFDVPGYKKVLKRQLLRELDYRVEAQTQIRLKNALCIAGLRIPEIVHEYSSEGVLVQSWEHGERFDQVCTWPREDRLEIGRILLSTLFQGLFVHGEVHGDPHMGNYLFQRGQGRPATVSLLDFGCTVFLNPEQRMSLLALICACRVGKPIDLVQGFARLGFDSVKLARIANDLPALCRILFKPFLSAKPFHCREWQLNTEMRQLLNERRWWFRSAAPVEWFPWMRVFHGLIQQLNALDVALPWWPLLEHYVGADLLDRAQKNVPLLTAFPQQITESTRKFDSARLLRVQIERENQGPATIDLPAEAAFELKSFIPMEIYHKLVQAGHREELENMEQRLKHQGLQPGPLFTERFEGKKIRVWLE